jgi:hypothetical protein
MSSPQVVIPSKSHNVRVCVKVRPLLSGEKEKSILKLDDSGTISIPDENSTQQVFKFDAIYSDSTSQGDFFDKELIPLLDNVTKGYNATVFCYGITSSGKTYTMQGTNCDSGVIPKTIAYLLKGHGNSVKFNFFEIYNEKAFDLMNPKNTQELSIREDKNRKIVIGDLTDITISTFEDFQKSYAIGLRNRRVAFNGINKESSRSHGIVCFTITSKNVTSKLYLCDLAGCEDNRKTQNTGIRMSESSNINTSLFNLRKCVMALNSGETRIPFRDSKLTRILQDSLGGSSLSLMIVNIAPYYSADVIKTLHFAMKSKCIVNSPVIQMQPTKVDVVSPLMTPKIDVLPIESPPIEIKPSEVQNADPPLIFSPRTKVVLVKDYIKRGKSLMEKQMIPEGIDCFKKALKIIPENDKLRGKIEKMENSLKRDYCINRDGNRVLRLIDLNADSVEKRK